MLTQPVWYPSEELISSTRLYQWMRRLGFDSYDEFFQASVRDIRWFWQAVENELSVNWFTPYRSVLELPRGVKWPEWFVGGQTNLVANALEKWQSDPDVQRRPAIIYESEEGHVRTVTYRELASWVERVARGLKELGIERGDRVGIFLPMIPEAAVAMLAVAKIGAIFTNAFSGFAADPVAWRLEHAEAKVLITADGYRRRGKVVPMKEVADRAVDMVPKVEKVVVVPHLERDIPWNPGRDIRWDELEKEGNQPTEWMESSDPFMLIYTSGTTGRPKGTVHTHSGFPIKAAFDIGYMLDVKHGDVVFWITDMGWVMGPMVLLGCLYNAATMVLYDGSPDHPNPDRVWQLVERHGVNLLGLSPTFIRALMPHGVEWVQSSDLSSLKAFASTGEPWNPEPWLWLFEKVGKKQLPILNISGGTEISGGIIGTTMLRPIAPITFNTALPGMDADVFDQDGRSVIDQVGELVVKQPWVGMTRGFWKEPERFEETYWNRWKDIWAHGDATSRDKNGFWIIQGRSDDTLNVAGKRMGPAEMESILVEHPGVKESAVIGVPDEIKGEVPICFVVLNQGYNPSEWLAEELQERVGDHLGKSLKPKSVYFVDDLPKTRSAKIMRRVIRSAFLNLELGDLSSLENPESVNLIKNLR
ncbi:AMP-binding protein [Parageobacillus thermoglucosidasius]|uniref:AMP-binding protein n=1 Tax=Parageobacillus thermoglucosidasius TaxID=1426 RepID=UPI000B584A20|nr:AMP-binding protein [Parageobacillus thermoglucosidasius]OUM92058.1 MAG: AMP-dependent synthetase [Parageobacillus thermoglucosidasius]